MNSKRYRKRKTGTVPMSAVRLRESHSNRGTIPRHKRRCYPLFESWNSVFNFKNLLESLMDWEDYSTDQEENVKQVGRLLQEVEKHGTREEVEQAANLVCEEVLSYLPNPDAYYRYFSRLTEMETIKPIILNRIELLKECDRVSENYKKLNEQFNLNRLFIDACNHWGVDEAINRLCECSEWYAIPDIKTKFCVTVENALYGLSGLVQEHELPIHSVIEAAIDYYLVNEGCKDTYAYFQDVREAVEASDFIPDVAEPYLQFLEDVRDDKRPYLEEVDAHYSNPAIQAIAEYDQYLTMRESIEKLYEAGSLNDAREWIAKLKIAPIRNVNMVKEGIRAMLITRRLQDIQDGVHNALALVFYGAVVVGFISLGALAGVLGLITAFILHAEINKQYLRNAIDEWKDHRYSVERKIRVAKDPTQRRRLQAYLDEVERNIELLTTEYEKRRDRTADEMDKEGSRRSFLPGNDDGPSFTPGRSAEVDPLGNVTPAASANSLINAADRRSG